MNYINKPNTAYAVETAKTISGETAIDFSKKDGKTVFVCQNSATSASVLTIEAGDGLQAVSDLKISVPASSSVCFTLESGKFKKLYGENKGCVVVSGSSLSLQVYSAL